MIDDPELKNLGPEDSIEKGFLWLGDEVDKEEEKIVLDFCEELDLEWSEETDVEEV